MLNVVMLNVVMLSVIMLNVVMMSVVLPSKRAKNTTLIMLSAIKLVVAFYDIAE
jgi:hypothetical protein